MSLAFHLISYDGPHMAALAGVQDPAASGEVLRTVLDSQTLLIGCIAAGLIALFTVGKVSVRRRQSRNIRREMQAHTQAMHAFLNTVRSDHGTARQGVWHYDFKTGAQQFTDNLKQLLLDQEGAGDNPGDRPDDEAGLQEVLQSAGVNLPAIAREHVDRTEPYEIEFTLNAKAEDARVLILQACNMRASDGKVQRMVAIIRESEGETSKECN